MLAGAVHQPLDLALGEIAAAAPPFTNRAKHVYNLYSGRRGRQGAKMPFPIHPHMLRHACGFKLANDGHDTRALQHYLGHKNIQHTVRYTELSPDRFKDFWRG